MQQKKTRRGREYLNDFRRDVNGSYLYQGSYRRYTGSMPYAKLRGLLWALCGGALAALAAAGRILFGPIPDFKPVSAIAIIAGATLGRRNGFMVGALAALTSNFFFGQGMWTPWQMYAWGLVGYVGGALAYAGAFDRADGTVRMPALLTYGFASGLLYGVVINAYDIIGFVQPLTWAGAAARLATAVPFDITHGLATCVFLTALYKPWCRRINRVVVKQELFPREL